MFDLSSDGFNYGMVILSEAKNLGMSINETLRFAQGDRQLDNNSPTPGGVRDGVEQFYLVAGT